MTLRSSRPIGSDALITLERWIAKMEDTGMSGTLLEKVRLQLIRRLIDYSDTLEHPFWVLDLTDKQLSQIKKGHRPLIFDALDYLTAHAQSPTFSYEIQPKRHWCFKRGAQVRGTWT